jgi:hypothetical protein
MRFATSVGTGVSCPPMRSVRLLNLNVVTRHFKTRAEEKERAVAGSGDAIAAARGRRVAGGTPWRGGGPFVGPHRNRIAEESRMKSSKRVSARL